MARSTTIIAFCATVGLAVPAGWHMLGASIQSEAKKLRPLQQKVTIDGAEVAIDIDKGVVITGDAVVAKLVATAPEAKRVAVDLWVMQSHNYEGGRVEVPDVMIDKEHITLEAAPGGGKAVTTKLVLGSAVAAPGQIDSFKVVVLPRGVSPRDSETSESSDYGAGEGKAAVAHVMGWSGNGFDIAIKTHGKLTDEPFKVSVRIENTTDKALTEPAIYLGNSVTSWGVEEDSGFGIMPADENEGTGPDYDDNGPKHSWKPGQVRVRKFIVTPGEGAADQVTLVARAMVTEDMPGPVITGAMDARTLKLKLAPKKPAPEAEPTVAANTAE